MAKYTILRVRSEYKAQDPGLLHVYMLSEVWL